MTKKTITRIYSVTRKGQGATRLVKAPNWAQALRHVANDEYTVEVADQEQLVECTSLGVKVEIAGGEPVASAALSKEPASHMEPTSVPGWPERHSTIHAAQSA